MSLVLAPFVQNETVDANEREDHVHPMEVNQMIGFDDLKELAAIQGPCVTIFQPLRDSFSQVTKADTRVTAAAQKADTLLAGKIFDAAARDEFLRPIFKLAANTDWSERSGSMLIFRAPGFTKASFWPDILDATVRVADEFFILPLLPGLARLRNFWVLALSIKKVQLFRGTLNEFSEVSLPEDLHSLAEAEAFDKPDHTLESRHKLGVGTAQPAAVRSGTSTINETLGQYLHDFFKKIDRGIQRILAGSGDPLILAAVERELAIYREVNTYPALLGEAIQGSPDPLGADWLRREAIDVLAKTGANAAAEIQGEMERASRRGLLTTDFGVIEEAARNGQIHRMFVEPRPASNEERINQAALAAVRNGGTVAACETLDTSAAAILRYRMAQEPQPQVATSRT